MEILIGTYEELILGYKVIKSDDGYTLKSSFTDHSHMGCVKVVSVSEKGVLASGSSDEMIRLYNLRSRKEMGALAHHQGTVTSLAFHGKQHMISGSEDGTLGVWKAGRWECLRTLRGHKDHVIHLSIHPSGKMALSISKDKTLKTWNLMTGKCAYTTSIKLTADLVLWSPSGNEYVLVAGDLISVYKVETGTVHQTIKCSSRICSALFLNDAVLAVGCEGGDIHLFDLVENKHITEFATETNRVKSMCRCQHDDQDWLISASSDGTLQMWQLQNDQDKWAATKVMTYDTKFRPTCIAAHVSSGESKEEADAEEVKEKVQVKSTKDTQITKKRKVIVETETISPKKVKKDKSAVQNKKQMKKKKQLF